MWTSTALDLPLHQKPGSAVRFRPADPDYDLDAMLGVHVAAPTIHAGFGHKPDRPDYPGSSIQLEIWNFGPVRVVLQTGMRICQLSSKLWMAPLK
jgi:dCTP deaminase